MSGMPDVHSFFEEPPHVMARDFQLDPEQGKEFITTMLRLAPSLTRQDGTNKVCLKFQSYFWNML